MLPPHRTQALSMRMRREVEVRDRWLRLHVTRSCFVGSDAVNWMVHSGAAPSRAGAVAVGNLLISQGLIVHVTDDHLFKDSSLLYRFVSSSHGQRLPQPQKRS